MNKLAELKKYLAEQKGKGLALLDVAANEDRDLTDDEQVEYDAIKSEIDKTEASIKRQEALNDERRAMTPLSPAGENVVNDTDPALTGGFADIGEFAVAVRNANAPGGSVDRRLVAANHQGGGGHGEGFTLPAQFTDNIWDLVNDFDEFGPLIDEEPTARREVKIPADESTPWGSSGVKAYWRAEGAKMTPTDLADEGRNVPLHELYAMVTATEELLEDSPRLANRLGVKSAQAIAWKKNLAVVEGSGVGQPLGWMKSNALISVAKESGQAAATIVPQNVLDMYSRLITVPGDRPFWLTNSVCLPQLMLLKHGDNMLWMPPNGMADAPGGFLMGLPVRFSEFGSDLGAKGDLQLISPKGYYGARRSAGVKFASSMHLYFDYGKEAFRWTFRYGGQPHLSKPQTPAKTTTTKSHFLTLAPRT